MSSKIPRGFNLPAEMKKSAAGAPATAANTAPKPEGVLKAQRENVPKKNVAPKIQKGVWTRYGPQADLKEQNPHLVAANEELQKHLTESQQRVTELELQFSDLEKENAEVQKKLKNCHILLVAAKIDPVLGEQVGEAAQQNEDQRKEAMSVSSDLLNELKTFSDTASRQRVKLEEIQATMTELMKAREHMARERENFSLEAAELDKALSEAESLLL